MVPDGLAPPTVTDKAFLLRLLTREDEVAQAKQPGQGIQEALQCMRQAAEVFGTMSPWHPNRSEPSAFGAAEHEKQAALAQHRAILEQLRQQDELCSFMFRVSSPSIFSEWCYRARYYSWVPLVQIIGAPGAAESAMVDMQLTA